MTIPTNIDEAKVWWADALAAAEQTFDNEDHRRWHRIAHIVHDIHSQDAEATIRIFADRIAELEEESPARNADVTYCEAMAEHFRGEKRA